MKDHEKRELVSELVGIARIASGTEQLRDRIAYALAGVFSSLSEATARAERAEAELAKLRQHEPVATLVLSYDGADFEMYYDNNKLRFEGMSMELYAAPIPAPVAQVPQEPIATVYIGSGHCKVAFTDAAKEAMKGKQGQSFDVYADPMPRAVKESLTAESTAAQAPQDATCKQPLQVTAEWREVLSGLVAIAEKKGKKQGSPNHCHRIPGIWDDDNGPDLSGKPCAECAVYDKARALLQEVKP